MFSRILVGVDGSECARRAFDAAAELARASNASLVVLCVVQPPMLVGQRKETAARFVRILEREAKMILADYAHEADRKDVKAETRLAKGHPAKVILETAHAEEADLVVVGSRGRGGVKGMLLGSVSSAVVQNAKVPVLVAK
ncbi:universal stress protein [Nitrososphaera sp.]|uniref:universal stress protein n=1 Tax=Nitrososphaera sp. TaxID=1971748 RepID=UPI003178E8F7